MDSSNHNILSNVAQSVKALEKVGSWKTWLLKSLSVSQEGKNICWQKHSWEREKSQNTSETSFYDRAKEKASSLYFLPQIHRDNSLPPVNSNTRYFKVWIYLWFLYPCWGVLCFILIENPEKYRGRGNGKTILWRIKPCICQFLVPNFEVPFL